MKILLAVDGSKPAGAVRSALIGSTAPTVVFLACAVWLVGLGAYFIWIRPPLLPEDTVFMEKTGEAIAGVLPRLAAWLDRVFTVMGGFMIASGVLTARVALDLLRQPSLGAAFALAAAGVAGVCLMSAINFALHSDYRWLLLGPAVLWIAGVLLVVAAARARA